MMRIMIGLLGVCVLSGVLAKAQAPTSFKLGTFERGGGRPFVGIVVREAVVIDFAAAHAAVTPASTVAPPTDMKDLIARYDMGLRARIAEIIRSVEAAGNTRPAYVFDVS